MKNYLVRDVAYISNVRKMRSGNMIKRDILNIVSEDIADLIGRVIDYYGLGVGIYDAMAYQGRVHIDGDLGSVMFYIYQVGDSISDDEIEYAIEPYL